MNTIFSLDGTLSLRLAITLLHFLWQGLALAVIAVVCNASIGRMSAKVRYWISFSALLLMLACLLATFGLVGVEGTPAPNVATLASDSVSKNVALVMPEQEVARDPVVDTTAASMAPSSGPGLQSQARQFPQIQTTFFESWAWLAPYVAIVYLIGIALMAIRFAIAFYGGDRLRRGAQVVTNRQWLKSLDSCIDQVKCSIRPTLMTCDRIATPLIVGVLKPVILLPTSLLSELAPSQLENILLHELAHLRRFDNIANLLQRIVETLLFFHPAVWYVSRRVSDERENCCDDLVLAVGAEPGGYAETLVRVSELGQQRAKLAAAASLAVDGGRKSQLRTRISRVMGVEDKTPFRSSRATTVFVLSLLGMLAVSLWAQLEASPTAQAESEGTLTVIVVDSDGAPIQGASLEIKTWDSHWKNTNFKGTTDSKGEVSFKDFEPDDYAAALVKHPDYAPVLQHFSFNGGQSSQVSCTLLRADVGTFRIVSPDDKPIAGAMIMQMEVANAESNNKMFLGHRDFEMLSGRPGSDFVSDASGLIETPPLPAGSTVNLVILHPHWKYVTVKDAKIEDLKSTTLVMKPGTIVTAKLTGDDSILKELEGKEVELSWFTNHIDQSKKNYSIQHFFPVKDGAIQFCLESAQYDGLSLTVDDFLITPSFGSSLRKFEFNNISDTERLTKHFVVRRRLAAKGRAVTEEGKPIANATVMVGSQNLFVDDSQKQVPLPDYEFTHDFAETDKDGYYEISIPEGKTRLNVTWSGYYSQDEHLEFNFEPGKPLPDLILKPMPKITGKIVDPKGRAVEGAIARVIKGFGESTYVQADKDGNFEIEMEDFEYDFKTKKRMGSVKISAFDPHGPLASIVDVDLYNKEEFSNVVIELAEHDANWLGREIGDLSKLRAEHLGADFVVDAEKLAETMKEKYPNVEYRMQAPEFEGGTWFNTSSSSLRDFRGKYVLLDFWFIGCGPCERGFPTLKLAHDTFREKGFTVVSVHIAGQSPESVKQFCDARDVNFPLVIDDASEAILKSYALLGVDSFPSYFLIDPEGKVVAGTHATQPEQKPGASLHGDQIETIREHFLLRKAETGDD